MVHTPQAQGCACQSQGSLDRHFVKDLCRSAQAGRNHHALLQTGSPRSVTVSGPSPLRAPSLVAPVFIEIVSLTNVIHPLVPGKHHQLFLLPPSYVFSESTRRGLA